MDPLRRLDSLKRRFVASITRIQRPFRSLRRNIGNFLIRRNRRTPIGTPYFSDPNLHPIQHDQLDRNVDEVFSDISRIGAVIQSGDNAVTQESLMEERVDRPTNQTYLEMLTMSTFDPDGITSVISMSKRWLPEGSYGEEPNNQNPSAYQIIEEQISGSQSHSRDLEKILYPNDPNILFDIGYFISRNITSQIRKLICGLLDCSSDSQRTSFGISSIPLDSSNSKSVESDSPRTSVGISSIPLDSSDSRSVERCRNRRYQNINLLKKLKLRRWSL